MGVHSFDHHLQAEIFAKLRMHASVRYKDLRDPLIESSQFAYHLHELIKQQLVVKLGRGEYSLTPKGVMLAQDFSSETGKLRSAPQTYSLLFLRSKTGKWYVLERTKHPYIGMYACISGKVHFHETLAEAAARELRDFTMGKVTATPQYCGYASVLIKYSEQQTHVTGPVWFVDGVEETLLEPVRQGIPDWKHWETCDYEQFIPGWAEIVAMIESGKPGLLDLNFEYPAAQS
jgi:hypothetical protein